MTKSEKVKVINQGGPIGFTLFLCFIGAAVYFVQHSDGFGGFLLALLKAVVWPAFLIHRAFELLGV
jgi:hypothetical protein